jgi:hypothetical protein
LWASLLILAMLYFSCVRKKLIDCMVGLNSMSRICLKSSLRESGSITLTLARCEEKT